MTLKLYPGSAIILALSFFLFATLGCAHRPKEFGTGKASWYGGEYQGRLTASGEVFDKNKLTAAHRTLPFQTIVNVRNLNNGKSVRVRINDRGPFIHGRIIDLSEAAAKALGMIREGVIPVSVQVVRFGQESKSSHKSR
jgi:rare lipoprotein A